MGKSGNCMHLFFQLDLFSSVCFWLLHQHYVHGMRKGSIKREFELFGYHEEHRQDANRNDAGEDSWYMNILKQILQTNNELSKLKNLRNYLNQEPVSCRASNQVFV